MRGKSWELSGAAKPYRQQDTLSVAHLGRVSFTWRDGANSGNAWTDLGISSCSGLPENLVIEDEYSVLEKGVKHDRRQATLNRAVQCRLLVGLKVMPIDRAGCFERTESEGRSDPTNVPLFQHASYNNKHQSLALPRHGLYPSNDDAHLI
jgi:hypothetical protein